MDDPPVEVHDCLADAGLLEPRVVVDGHVPQVLEELGPDLHVGQRLVGAVVVSERSRFSQSEAQSIASVRYNASDSWCHNFDALYISLYSNPVNLNFSL